MTPRWRCARLPGCTSRRGARTKPRYAAWPRVNGSHLLNGFGAGVAAGPARLGTCESVIDDRVIAAGDRFRHAIPQLHARMRKRSSVAHATSASTTSCSHATRHRSFVMLDFRRRS